MATYYDSGSGTRSDYFGAWCESNILPNIESFRAQFGYYRFEAFANFTNEIRNVALSGQPVHIVLGSNSGSLQSSDLQNTLSVLSGGSQASLIVVAYQDVEFHPKVLHLTATGGSAKAVVGSANFTPSGLGGNVEAFVELDNQFDNPLTVQQVADSVDAWQSRVGPSVFHVTSSADIASLANDRVINLPQIRRPKVPRLASSVSTSNNIVTRRGRKWRPVQPGSNPVAIQTAFAPPQTQRRVQLRWCKQLGPSDAQKVQGNVTGKLRLTQSKFPIDHRTYFRNTLFSGISWAQSIRNNQQYDSAIIPFEVFVRGIFVNHMDLLVDHAPHRESGQGNVPTTLAWGTTLNGLFRSASFVGDWVSIERFTGGTFRLNIETAKPTWAP